MGDTPWGAAGARERRQGWLALLIPTPPARHRGRRPAPRSMVKFTGRASAGVVGSASPPPGGRSRSTSGGSPPGSTPACRPPGSGTELPGFVRSCAVSGSQRSGAGVVSALAPHRGACGRAQGRRREVSATFGGLGRLRGGAWPLVRRQFALQALQRASHAVLDSVAGNHAGGAAVAIGSGVDPTVQLGT